MEYGQSKRFLDSLADWEAGRPAGGPVEHNLPRMRRLLEMLGAPQTAFRSVIVGGTNGKGTTAGCIAHLLKAAGHRVGLYTSPHLHSIRERVQVDGKPVEKEDWSDIVTRLQHASFTFEEAGFGAFTKFEALTALAAVRFKDAGVDVGVFEVGLGGRYDATNAWDSELAVLTSVQLDHTEILGDTLEAIAEDKLQITRAGKPLLTPADHPVAVRKTIETVCASRDVPVEWVETERAWPGSAEDPRWKRRNCGLARAAALRLSERVAGVPDETATAFTVPGRHEVASRSPLVVLDGAHNPAAASALCEHLLKTAPRWRFVVGASAGHDAAGILRALAPAADTFLCGTSEHPRAVEPEALVDAAPGGVTATVMPRERDALKALLREDAGVPTCVTGSLHFVARAREVLGLVEEREGISEDVLLESLTCVRAAAERVGLTAHAASDDGNVVRVDGPRRSVYFLRNKHPFNDYVSAKLAEDKAYQYELFLNAGLRVPYTMKLFNPYADERFVRYQDHASVADLVEEIEAQMAYPVVVKRNQGSFAQGVYLEYDRAGLSERLDQLFRHSGYLNNVLVCQAFVAGREYRAVASGAEVHLVYEKQGPLTAESGGDLNPLHRPGGQAVRVEDPAMLKSFRRVAECISEALDLGFYAIDAIAGVDGLSVLEVNPNPVCYFYNDHNGRADFVDIYAKLLQRHVQRSTAEPEVTVEVDEN